MLVEAALRTLVRSRFVKRLTLLSGGTFLGQALVVLSSPLLTRLYAPEEFGFFAVFSALSAIMAVAIGLRYEFAIPVARDDVTAAALVAGIALVSLALSFLMALLIWLAGPTLAERAGMAGLAPLLWLLPFALFFWGIGSALTFWSIRRGYFRSNALNRIVYNAIQAGSQIGFGFAGLGVLGLALGYSLGYVARAVHLAMALPLREARRFFRQPATGIRAALGENWQYPAYSAVSAVLHSMCNMLPVVLIAAFYGPAMAGWFGLAQRVVALPVRLFSETASQVFLGEIATADHRQLLRLFKRVATTFLFIGLVGLMPVALAGPRLFGLVFGADWTAAGMIVQLLAPLYLARFVVSPVSQTLNVLKRQDLHLVSSLINGTTVAVSFSLGWALKLEGYTTILLYSLASSAAFVFYITMTWIMLRRAVTASPAV